MGQGNPVVFSGTVTTDGDGDIDTPQFVWDTTGADEGVYKVEVECPLGTKKSDNFSVDDPATDDPGDEVPEFGVIGAALALGLAGLFIWKRRN